MNKFIILRYLLVFIAFFSFGSQVAAETHAAEKKAAPVVRKKRIKKVVNEEKVKAPDALVGENNFSGDNSKVPEDIGIQTVIVLDSSRSMIKTDPKKIRDQGVRLFLQFLEPQDSFAIIQFAEESKVVQPFLKISQTTPENISSSLKEIRNEGNFTDFLTGLELAESLFAENANNKSNDKKVLILMTDGQNDPNPVKYTAENVKKQILKSRLPSLKKKGIRVYTLALSELADRPLLAEISKNTNGLSWYADEVNEVHRIFSDLFLTLKKPQVLELTKDGFEIDSSSNEATFFVNRKLETESVTVIDPNGNEYSNKDFPGNWKWFRGNTFDVITVPSPLPGTWGINGSDGEVSGFAKLLTNLTLEHDWPEGTLSVGDNAVLRARLTGDPVILNDPQVKDLIFYSYKIINLKTGGLYLQGKLADSGTDGDLKQDDNIFSTTIALNEEGNFKIFLSAIGPTFSRQGHIPVSVSRGAISFEKIPANEFTKKPETYLVKLHGESLNLKNRKVSLVSQIVDQPNSAYSVKLTENEGQAGSFEVPLGSLKEGLNKAYAVVVGSDDKGHESRSKSEELEILVSKQHKSHDEHAPPVDSHGELNVPIDEVHSDNEHADAPDSHGEDVENKEGEVPSFWLYGLIGPFLSLIIGGVVARIFVKKSTQEKGVQIAIRTEYKLPEELEVRVSSITTKGSVSRKRVLKPEEIEIFSVLPELAQGLIAVSDKAASSQEDIENQKIAETEEGDNSEPPLESTDSSESEIEKNEDENIEGSTT